MTVAPQKDICPQGKTYPKKAVPITKTNMILPATLRPHRIRHVSPGRCQGGALPG